MPTYSYAEVEGALANLYAAKVVQQTTFRGRLKHFRKLQIPEEQPGKGSRIRYSLPDIFQLLIAFEFAELGLDPHLIATIVRRHWRHKFTIAVDWTERFRRDDFCIAIELRCASSIWDRKWIHEWYKETDTGITAGATTPVAIQVLKATDVPTYSKEMLKQGRRFAIFNLSVRIRGVMKALESEISYGSSEATLDH
jgi:hypothetical protein